MNNRGHSVKHRTPGGGAYCGKRRAGIVGDDAAGKNPVKIGRIRLPEFSPRSVNPDDDHPVIGSGIDFGAGGSGNRYQKAEKKSEKAEKAEKAEEKPAK